MTATCCTLCQTSINVTCGLGQSCAAACFAESASLCPSHDCGNCHNIEDTILASSTATSQKITTHLTTPSVFTKEPSTSTYKISSSKITTSQASTTISQTKPTTVPKTTTDSTTTVGKTTTRQSTTNTVPTTTTLSQRVTPTESPLLTTTNSLTSVESLTPEAGLMIEVNITGKGNFTLFANSVVIGSGSTSFSTYTFTSENIVGRFLRLVVKAHNWVNKMGIIVATSNGLFTNSTWRCIKDTGQTLPPISQWPKAKEVISNDQMQDWEAGPGKHSKGKWIWTQEAFGSVACSPDEGEL